MLTFFDRDDREAAATSSASGVGRARGGRADLGRPGRPAGAGRGPGARAADGQVGDLPVPARRPEPVRDVRPEDGRARGHPQRHGRGRHPDPRRDLRRVVPPARRAGRPARRSSGRSCPATPTTTSSRSSAATPSAPTSARVYSRVAGANHPQHRHADQRRPLPARRRRLDAGRPRRASAGSTPPARSPRPTPLTTRARAAPAAGRPEAGHPARPARRPPRACSPRLDGLAPSPRRRRAVEGLDADAASRPTACSRAAWPRRST